MSCAQEIASLDLCISDTVKSELYAKNLLLGLLIQRCQFSKNLIKKTKTYMHLLYQICKPIYIYIISKSIYIKTCPHIDVLLYSGVMLKQPYARMHAKYIELIVVALFLTQLTWLNPKFASNFTCPRSPCAARSDETLRDALGKECRRQCASLKAMRQKLQDALDAEKAPGIW